MSLDSIQCIAASGLANVSAGLGVIGQNVANAGTAGYSREVSTQSSLTAGGQGMGVLTGLVGRSLDATLQASVQRQSGTVAGLQTRQQALQQLDAVLGATGAGGDLASLVTGVQTTLAALRSDPANQTQQQAVAAAAGVLAAGINTVSQAVGDARQTAQDGAVADVGAINAVLTSIGQVSDQIVRMQAVGDSTADLQNQRDGLVNTLSALVPVRTVTQPNGDIAITTAGGLGLATRGGPALSLAAAALGPSQYYPGGSVPDVMLGNADVSGAVGGGQLGARLVLRDATLPADQAGLDSFAQTLASRFDAQGLRLFSDAGGKVPATTATLGFANVIQVNPAVAANAALVRDGTAAIAGSPGGASGFTPNPAGGPAGSTTLIDRLLAFALGTQAQAGVAQPMPPATGLGAAGTIALPYPAPTTLTNFAAALVGAMAQDSASTTGQLATEQGLQTTLQGKLASGGGVSVDTEMSAMVTLQNSYSANAKVIATVQNLWTVLFAMMPA